jgi:hypothetical protein
MAKTLQFRRLSTAALANTVGANGELIVDSSNGTISVHNGTTSGGKRLATETYVVNTANQLITAAVPTRLGQLTNDFGYITSSASITGGSATAIRLFTPRYINGVAFDGTANISIVGANANVNVVVTESLAQSAFAQANTASNTASSAQANTIILQDINTTQNTRITVLEGVNTTQNTRITVLEGVNTTQNTNITTVTGLAQASFDLANTISAGSVDILARTTSNTATNNIVILQGVDTTQNTRITSADNTATAAYAKANAAFDKANTVVSTSIDDYARTTANTSTNNITILQGVNTTQNTNISSVNNLATSAFAKANTNISSDLTLTVTNSGSGAYLISGASNPTLTLYRGVTYYFSISASGHPFYIQTVSGAYSAGNLYTSGITGAGTQVGTLTFTVPLNAPNNLYYVCQNHSAMNGAFLIENLISTVDGSISTTELKALVANAATYAAFQSAIAAL